MPKPHLGLVMVGLLVAGLCSDSAALAQVTGGTPWTQSPGNGAYGGMSLQQLIAQQQNYQSGLVAYDQPLSRSQAQIEQWNHDQDEQQALDQQTAMQEQSQRLLDEQETNAGSAVYAAQNAYADSYSDGSYPYGGGSGRPWVVRAGSSGHTSGGTISYRSNAGGGARMSGQGAHGHSR